MQKNNLIITIAAFGIAMGILGTGYVYAQADTSTRKPITQRIAERFNLNQADVQKVFDEQRNEMQQYRQQNMEERLGTLVSDGKLTEDQKNALIAKLNEKHENMDEFRNLSADERHEKMEQARTEFEAWLEENGIDKDTVGMGIGSGFGRGGPKAGGMRGFGGE